MPHGGVLCTVQAALEAVSVDDKSCFAAGSRINHGFASIAAGDRIRTSGDQLLPLSAATSRRSRLLCCRKADCDPKMIIGVLEGMDLLRCHPPLELAHVTKCFETVSHASKTSNEFAGIEW